jgi:hypothetical protein
MKEISGGLFSLPTGVLSMYLQKLTLENASDLPALCEKM